MKNFILKNKIPQNNYKPLKNNSNNSGVILKK